MNKRLIAGAALIACSATVGVVTATSLNRQIEDTPTQEAGFWRRLLTKYLFGGNHDRGDWYCGDCSVNVGDPGSVIGWNGFIPLRGEPANLGPSEPTWLAAGRLHFDL